ncbi:LytR/AlgR family response regulator transcription factor [Mucilaginibacter lutimaris]|uniref:LytR/AlgR family response regulator transcription factor n=1 Tax=Mucilaginibacter lutimaris TaxID=931629 RepID=A0ABW2ZLK7_9SPHI
MKNLNCLVIDDERHAAELMSAYIEKTPGLSCTGIYTNPLKALENFDGNQQLPDITLLDIDMPELSGMDLAGLINHRTTVVFTTSYREFAPEAFEQNAADYLLKPVSYERFLTCIQKIRGKAASIAQPVADYFFVQTDIKGKIRKIDIPEIRYIESKGNYVQLFLGKEKVLAYLTLSEVLDYLPKGQFSRIQKSIVVAHTHIRSVEHFQVRLQDLPEALPIGRAFSGVFLREMQTALLISKRKLMN